MLASPRAGSYSSRLMNGETVRARTKYAVVELNGRQFRVEEGDVLTVDRVPGDVGAQFELGSTLLADDGAQIRIGTPNLNGATVKATVLAHERAAKILVFKFKKVKNYRRKRGHRQEISRIRIDSITL